MRFHDLRHVAQVYAAEAGAILPELMARLGHATPAAAMVYLHARADRDHALTDALSAAMASSGGSGEPRGRVDAPVSASSPLRRTTCTLCTGEES